MATSGREKTPADGPGIAYTGGVRNNAVSPGPPFLDGRGLMSGVCISQSVARAADRPDSKDEVSGSISLPCMETDGDATVRAVELRRC